MAEEKIIGRITHYFNNISVGIVELVGDLKVGDKIKVKGSQTDFEQAVDSMQVEHESRTSAKNGDAIGIKMTEKVKEGDLVYKISE